MEAYAYFEFGFLKVQKVKLNISHGKSKRLFSQSFTE